MVMSQMMSDFKRISDALYSSNEILQKEHLPEEAKGVCRRRNIA